VAGVSEERLIKVLLAPHVSEKSTAAADRVHQHVFKVLRNATKTEIKKPVELMFSVQVTQVRVMNQKGKLKRHGARRGRRSDWKKAYVKLAADQDINLAGVE
jgi:large subunit ribosomal protein L23